MFRYFQVNSYIAIQLFKPLKLPYVPHGVAGSQKTAQGEWWMHVHINTDLVMDALLHSSATVYPSENYTTNSP